MDWCNPTCYAIKILDAKYDAVSIEDVVKECMHLSEEQRADLQVVLSKFQKLFSGKLGVFPYQKFHIELDPGARPKHVRPYAIPRIHLAAFKKELEHLDKIGYRYNVLPMGLKCSPDFAQETMESIFHDLQDEVEVYIDDIGASLMIGRVT
ncbi:hypothetical protein ACHAXH_002430 [Discostella pseudostelligera]